jgi:hypothetical protein
MSSIQILDFSSFEHAQRSANLIANSSFCPGSFKGRPIDVLLAVAHGGELGIQPLQALQNIAVINGKPAVWGDLMKALCERAVECMDIIETFDEDIWVAVCIVKRKDKADVVAKFSKEDAQKANLWGKQGPWTTYPKRMLQMRARGFALRDAFPHLLKGLISAEEAQDSPAIVRKPINDGNIIEHTVNEVVPITVETLEKLAHLITFASDPFATEEAILRKARVKTLAQLTEEAAQGWVNMMEAKMQEREKEPKEAPIIGAIETNEQIGGE